MAQFLNVYLIFMVIFVILYSHKVYGGQILSSNSYQACNLTNIDPIQPSFQSTTCTYFTRITSTVDGGQNAETKLPTIDVVGNPFTPFRDNTDNLNSLETCGQNEVCTITTPIDMTFTGGDIFSEWNLLYAGWNIPWSYVSHFQDGLSLNGCSSTGSLDPINPLVASSTCDAESLIGPTPANVCSESNITAATCPPLDWEFTKKLQCFRMCCDATAVKSGRSYFVWRTDTQATTYGLTCKVYKPYVQPVLTQSMTVEISSDDTDVTSFTMRIEDIALGGNIGTYPAIIDTDSPLNARMIIRSLNPYSITNISSVYDYIAGSLVVICEDEISETASTAKRPSCLNTPSNKWMLIPPTYAERYGTTDTSYGATPGQIMSAMAQSTEVCAGTLGANQFVPGLAEDSNPPDPSITTKISPSVCDMMAQTEAGYNYWLPPRYDNTGGIANNPNWFISGTKLYYRVDPDSVSSQILPDVYNIQVDLTTNIMEYLNTTSPGFFDPSYSKCYTTGYTNSSRTVATGKIQVRVCNEDIVDNIPIKQAYEITYTCDPRMSFSSLVLTTSELAVGTCEVVDNLFTFLVSSVNTSNMGLACNMVLSPGGSTIAGQTSTVCNQFPNFLNNFTCNSTDLACFNKKGNLTDSAFFWILIGGGTFALVLFIIIIALAATNSKKKHNTPEKSVLEAAEPILNHDPPNIYANALAPNPVPPKHVR